MAFEFQRAYLYRLPLPLAQLYSRAHNGKDARSRHDNVFYLFEAAVKLAAAPTIACYLQESDRGVPGDPALDRLLGQLALPSLGQWLGMLRELARHFGARPDAASHLLGHLWRQLTEQRDRPALLALYRRIKNGPDGLHAGDQSCSLLEVLAALVQYRNGVFGHGAGRFDAFYEKEMGPLLLPAATEFLEDGVFDLLGPRGSRLVYLTELRLLDGGRVEVGLRELIGLEGERAAPLTLPAEQAAGLAPNRVALLGPGQAVPLRLDPLLLYRESELAEEVLFLNRDRNGRQVEYLSYTTGRIEREKATAADLAALLGRVAGRPVAVGELPALAEQSRTETPAAEGLPAGTAAQGKVLGDYEVLAEIGRGGMGIVYLARQQSLGRLVALKMLPGNLAGDEVALARFRREVRALARCEHPHIVKVLAGGTLPDGRHYYAMEYVPGCDLERLWRELVGEETAAREGGTRWGQAVLSASRKQREDTVAPSGDPTAAEKSAPLPLPPLPELPLLPQDSGGYARHVAQLGRDAALALQAVHDQGLVHRDIKPANLMLTADGTRVVLMDFGLAKGQTGTREVSRGGGLLGTLRYAAPEQLAAARQQVGPAADVRGLGSTLWELLTRRRLFAEAEDEAQLAQKVREEDVPRLRALDSGLDRDLEAIVARATEREPAVRIGTAGQLAGYLQLYLEGKPLPIRPPGLGELTWRWVRGHVALVSALAGAVGVAVLTLVLALMVMGQRRAVEQGVKADLEEWSRLLGQERWPEGRAVLKRARERLNDGGSELRPRVEQAQRDLDMAVRLEEIYLGKLQTNNNDKVDLGGTEQAYREAFRSYGLDVEQLAAEEAARQIKGAAIREQLVTGLDDWLLVKIAEKLEGANRLLALVQQADESDTRRRIRAAREGNRLEELKALVQEIHKDNVPRSTFLLLGLALSRTGAQKEAATVLKQGQCRYPGDVWLNCFLAGLNGGFRNPDTIGYSRAALAVRPDNPVLHSAVAYALRMKGDLEGAIAEYRQVIRLNRNSPTTHQELGFSLKKNGDLEGGIAEYREAIRLKKDFPEAQRDLGNALYQKGDVAGAIAAYREAIRLKKDYPEAQCDLGNALDQDLAGAIAAYREAIRLKKDFPEAHRNLGIALWQKGDLAEGIGEIQEAIRLKKDFPDAQWYLGRALYQKGDVAGAIVAYREAIRLKKDFPDAQCDLGNALDQKGDLAGAIAAYREAIRLKKDFPEAYNGLGVVLWKKGDQEEGIAEFRQAIQLKKDYPEAHRNLGVTLHQKGDLAGAIAAFREAIRLKKDFPEAQNGLGNALNQKGDLPGAIAAFREAIRLKKDFPEAQNGLGNALDQKGDLVGTAAAYRAAVRLKKDFPEAHTGLGNILVKEGNLGAAVTEFREAIRLRKDFPDAHNGLGVALHTAGDMAGAIAAYREAIRLKKDDPQFHHNLGLALYERGDQDDAIGEIREAIRLKRDYPEAYSSLDKAARRAALAGSGRGAGAGNVDKKERVRLHRQALAWLRAALDLRREQMESKNAQWGTEARQNLNDWQKDLDLAGVRDPQALATLPEAERREWQAFWAEVDHLLQQSHPAELRSKRQKGQE